jgi:NADH-quinone oxidoreductase subunit L
MTLPLIVLAIGTILLSVLLTPAWPWLDHYLLGEKVGVEMGRLFQPVILLSLMLVALGIGGGVLVYGKVIHNRQADPLATAQPALFRFLANRMWLDELYQHTVIAFSRGLAVVLDWFDRWIWDGMVRLVGSLGQVFGIVTTGVDENTINRGVDGTTVGARGFGRVLAAAHSGKVQSYLGIVGIGMLALLIVYAWLG